MAPPREPFAALAVVPAVPAHGSPRPAPVALVRLQVAEPAHGGEGVGLVREAEGRFVAAEAIVAVEQVGEAETVDAGPEIVGRMLGLGRAHRGSPAPVVGAAQLAGWERVRRQRPALAADRGVDGCERGAGGRLHEQP
jgi:hypothetical protein